MDNETCKWTGCSVSFDNPKYLYYHVKEGHIGRKATRNLCLQCKWEQCNFTATKRDKISSHILVHVPLKSHLCQFCNKPFKRRHDLKKHEKIHDKWQNSARQSSHTIPHPSHQQNQQPFPHQMLTPPSSVESRSQYVSPVLSSVLSPVLSKNHSVVYPDIVNKHTQTTSSMIVSQPQVLRQQSVSQVLDSANDDNMLLLADLGAYSVEHNQIAATSDQNQNSGTFTQPDFSLNTNTVQYFSSIYNDMVCLPDSFNTVQTSQEPVAGSGQYFTDHQLLYTRIADLSSTIKLTIDQTLASNQCQGIECSQNLINTVFYDSMQLPSSEDLAFDQMPVSNLYQEEDCYQNRTDMLFYHNIQSESNKEKAISVQPIPSSAQPSQNIFESNCDCSFLSGYGAHIEYLLQFYREETDSCTGNCLICTDVMYQKKTK